MSSNFGPFSERDLAEKLIKIPESEMKQYYDQRMKKIRLYYIAAVILGILSGVFYFVIPDGIWATAPYLHNGSVQNLYELLLPANKRKTKFYVGSRKFDTKLVGFKSKQRRYTSLLDVSLPGNSNLGHEYGTSLNKSERWALIEFLKTL